MKSNSSLVALMLIAVIVSSCSTTDEEGAGLTDGTNNGVADASTSGFNSGTGISGAEMQAIDSQGYGSDPGMNNMGSGFGSSATSAPNSPEFSDPQNPLSTRTIYFQYDSSQIQFDFEPVISAHASYLQAHPGQRMILSGHADERGSREYNIALGEQRANSVANLLQMQGVSPGQLEIISYGEEKPAVEGQDDAAWQQNRRVEMGYQ